MRDYNQIPFRGPKKADHLEVPPDEKKLEAGSTSTAPTSGSTMRENASPEAALARLRTALEESSHKDESAHTALAKSDAVILELRSSVRQLKRQLEKSQEEKAALQEAYRDSMEGGNNNSGKKPDTRVAELQEQLDRAHAQILTADMVRKELEDTLEAEQYTWELRVQDQERTIQELQRECSTLAADLEQMRAQWSEAEEGWNKEIHDLQEKLERSQQELRQWKAMQGENSEASGLKERIVALEQERTDLQGCLDEALKELEAVDAELQGEEVSNLREENNRLKSLVNERSGGLVESLQHLYRWLLERDGFEDSVHKTPTDPRELMNAIQTHLQNSPSNDKDMAETRRQVAELETQLSVYKGDLKAREESSSELRASLKEAVALLKPLQDAVAKADKEKARLQEQIELLKSGAQNGQKSEEVRRLKKELEAKDDEIDRLKQEIESLEIQLSKEKMLAANSLVTAHNKSIEEGSPDNYFKAREELRAKRAQEQQLQDLLRNAQGRLRDMHDHSSSINARNVELEGELNKSRALSNGETSMAVNKEIERLQRELEVRDASLLDMTNDLKLIRQHLAAKEKELETIKYDSRSASPKPPEDDRRLGAAEDRAEKLEWSLKATKKELQKKKMAERALNKSLKEALDLLRPLQMHLEEAEQEKQELSEELMALRKRIGDDTLDQSRFLPEEHEVMKNLKDTVKRLEQENYQLHNVLEEMSQSVNASHLSGLSNMSQPKPDSRLREEIVELKSRAEVTQNRLEQFQLQNKSLSQNLRQKEALERQMQDELRVLREKLMRSETELENAKFIASSALVKEAEEQGNAFNKQQQPRDNLRGRGGVKVPYRLT